LRGIAANETWDEILAHSSVINDYLERCASSSKSVYAMSFDGLRKLYAKFSVCDAEECQQGIRDIIDTFSEERGPRVSNSYIQHDFARLIGFLAETNGCKSVFDPFAGKATFADYLAQHISFEGQEIDSNLCMLANLRLASLHRGEESVKRANSIGSFQKSDMIVSEMPWGIRELEHHQTYESFFLEEASFSASKISVGIYPYGILFRDGREKDSRLRLVDSDLIDCVIKLPADLYAPKTKVQTCIIITNRHKRNEGYVRFIDASSFVMPNLAYTRLDVNRLVQAIQSPILDGSHDIAWVSKEEILNNDANLAIERYQLIKIPEYNQLVPLKYILERITQRKQTEQTTVPLIRVSDLTVNPLEYTLASFKAEERPYRREYVYVDEPALFISKVRPIKPTFYVEDGKESGRGVYINPNVYAFRIIGKVTPPYLLNELSKDYVQKQLMFSGIGMPTISARDFLEVKIVLPSLEEQNLSIVEGFKERGEKEVMGAKRVLDAEMRQRAHTLGHPITDIGKLCRNLATLMKSQGGVLHYDDIVNRKGETVEEQMEKLLFASERAAKLAEQLTYAREFGKDEPIVLYDFLTKFIKEHDMPKFKPFFNQKKVDFRIRFSPEDLQTVLENIFSNIGKYSFPEEGFSPDNKVAIDMTESKINGKPAVSMLIMSTGEPLDDSLNPDDVFMWGYTSAKDPNHGFGGNQIKTAIEHFGGEVSFLTEQNLRDRFIGFITAYRIVLPLTVA